MLTKTCTLYCREQLKDGKDIGFPGQPNSSWLVCSLHFPQVEAVRCGADPSEATPGRETAFLINHSQTCPVPHSARDLSCCLPSHAPLLRPAPSTLSTPCCVFCSFSAGGRHWCRAWFVLCQSALAAASWLAEGEMLWCLAAMGVFLQGQRIPRCSPLLKPSPRGWDVRSCPLSSHLVDQNKLRKFSVFSLLMPSNV